MRIPFRLKKFYYNSTNLQYFKNLIKVPHLPEVRFQFLEFFGEKAGTQSDGLGWSQRLIMARSEN